MKSSLQHLHRVPRWAYARLAHAWHSTLSSDSKLQQHALRNLAKFKPDLDEAARLSLAGAIGRDYCYSAMELFATTGTKLAQLNGMITSIDDPDHCLTPSEQPTLIYSVHTPLLAAVHAVVDRLDGWHRPYVLVHQHDKRRRLSNRTRPALCLLRDRQATPVLTDVSGLRSVRRALANKGTVIAMIDAVPRQQPYLDGHRYGVPMPTPSFWHRLQRRLDVQVLWCWASRRRFLRDYCLHVRRGHPDLNSSDPQVYATAVGDQITRIMESLGSQYAFWTYRGYNRKIPGA